MPWLLKQKDHLMHSTMPSCRPVTWTACRHWNGTREGAHVGGLRRKFISQKWCVPKNHAQDTIQVANYFIFFLTQPPFPTAIAAFPHPQKAPSATLTVWWCVSFAVDWASHFWYDVSASARLVQTHQGWYRTFLGCTSFRQEEISEILGKFICLPKKVPSFLKSSKTSRDPKGGDSELGAMGQCCANPQRDDFDAWKMMVVTKCTKRLSFFFFEKKIDFTAIPIPNTFLEFLADKCTKQNQRWLNREPNSSDSPCLAKFGFTWWSYSRVATLALHSFPQSFDESR